MKLEEAPNLRLKPKAQPVPETKDKVQKKDIILLLLPSESSTVEYGMLGVRCGAFG
jgi:hypothetical protein